MSVNEIWHLPGRVSKEQGLTKREACKVAEGERSNTTVERECQWQSDMIAMLLLKARYLNSNVLRDTVSFH